jgi:serine-type D-Ala-D-Ala carboxypeptidase (penicillin-binding protein 5/6)
MVRRFTIVLTIFVFLFSASGADAKKRRKHVRKATGCRAVILSDSTKMKRLYGKNAEMRVLPASTTKVMTALLVLEKLSLNQYVTVSARATYVVPSRIDARPGERYRVKDLLFAILLNSANDASIVLAEAVAGSEWNFVQMMNARAKELGARSTKFANSNGLPTKNVQQYTTAYDMYLIFRQAWKHSYFREAIRHRNKTIYSQAGRQIALRSHNKMLFFGWAKDVFGKTGYTRSAGACFVGAVQKGQSVLIVGVFGCADRWNDIKRVLTTYGGVRL